MKMGIIGLGKMGISIAQRARDAGHVVVGFDIDERAKKKVEEMGITVFSKLDDIASEARIIWLMVPPGKPVDIVMQELIPHLKQGDIIIDGGNSKFTDSMRRAAMLEELGIYFLDCGTSGGLAGLDRGFCLMVGGDSAIYAKVRPLFEAMAAPGGLAHVGPSGAGHYVKMVHNGIEYALMQAYAEGFHLLHEGTFKELALDLGQISRVWSNGSVIRSWLLDLLHDILMRDQKISDISGEVAHSGMGKWTIEDARDNNVPVRVIEEAFKVRIWSEETGGNYATKLVSLLRQAFGGHAVTKIEK